MLLLILLWTGRALAGQQTESAPSPSESRILTYQVALQETYSLNESHTRGDVRSGWDTQKMDNFYIFYITDRARLANAATTDDYEETQVRRFETVFFISLPVSFLLSFLSTILYREFTGKTESFTNQDYGYIFISSIGISINIAIRDNKIVFHQDVHR